MAADGRVKQDPPDLVPACGEVDTEDYSAANDPTDWVEGPSTGADHAPQGKAYHPATISAKMAFSVGTEAGRRLIELSQRPGRAEMEVRYPGASAYGESQLPCKDDSLRNRPRTRPRHSPDA